MRIDYPSTTAIMIQRENEDAVLLRRRKGSNPAKKKLPAVKCPICKKFLYAAPNPTARNVTFVYDLKEKNYSFLPRDYTYRCPRCHNMLGIAYLTSARRRELGLPSVRDCHGKRAI